MAQLWPSKQSRLPRGSDKQLSSDGAALDRRPPPPALADPPQPGGTVPVVSVPDNPAHLQPQKD